MDVSDRELRELVRAAIARQAGQTDTGHLHVHPPPPTPFGAHSHASFTLLPLARGGDGDGNCLIEPAVRCNHCGYCLSYGH